MTGRGASGLHSGVTRTHATILRPVLLLLLILVLVPVPVAAITQSIYDDDFDVAPGASNELPLPVASSSSNSIQVGDRLEIIYTSNIPGDLLFFNDTEADNYREQKAAVYMNISVLSTNSTTMEYVPDEPGKITIFVDHTTRPPGGATPSGTQTLEGHLTVNLQRDSPLGWLGDLLMVDPNDPNFCLKQILLIIVSMAVFSLVIYLIKLPFKMWKRRRDRKKAEEQARLLGTGQGGQMVMASGNTGGSVSPGAGGQGRVLDSSPVSMPFNPAVQYYIKTGEGDFLPVRFSDGHVASAEPPSSTGEPGPPIGQTLPTNSLAQSHSPPATLQSGNSQESTVQGMGQPKLVRCPGCKGTITVSETIRPVKITCPSCGRQGLLRK